MQTLSNTLRGMSSSGKGGLYLPNAEVLGKLNQLLAYLDAYHDEPGATWLERVTRTYPACVWLNPVPEAEWDFTYSIAMVKQLMGGRMYPLTLEGLDRAMRELVR